MFYFTHTHTHELIKILPLLSALPHIYTNCFFHRNCVSINYKIYNFPIHMTINVYNINLQLINSFNLCPIHKGIKLFIITSVVSLCVVPGLLNNRKFN